MPSLFFIGLCRAELELCGITAGSRVAVLSQGDERREHVDAFLAAAEELDAVAFHIRVATFRSAPIAGIGSLTYGITPLAGNRPAIEALKNVDLVVDTLFLLFSKEQLEIQQAGVRILLCIEPVDHLATMFPTPRLRTRVEAAERLLAASSTLRFTNDAGTDITYSLGSDYPIITQYGYTDTPGRWDHWPSGFLFTSARDGSARGKVILAPGDIIFPFNSYVRTPIELEVAHGEVISITGGLDADLLQSYMDSFHDKRAFAISHIGWGMLETARWDILATDTSGNGMHGRSFYGNVLFSTGPNQELGGTNDTPCHMDIPMRNCSLYLDGEPIIVNGDIVVPELKALDCAET